MRGRTTKALVALLLLGPTAVAAAQAINALTLQAASKLWVEGTSTVRSFRCEAGDVTAEILSGSAEGVPAIMRGEKAVSTVAVTIPAARLDCRNGTMNGHMLKALKATSHPTIAFTLSSYELTKGDMGVSGTLTGMLSLGGVEKTITLDAVGTEVDGALRVTGSYPLVMTEYGLKPPSLMMGTMKVNEKVRVGFDLYIKG